MENDFSSQVLKSDIFGKIGLNKDTDSSKIKDFVLFILLILYLEVPYIFDLHHKAQHSKLFAKKVEKIKKEMLNNMDFIHKHILKFRLRVRSSYQQLKEVDFQTAKLDTDKLLERYFTSSQELVQLLEHSNPLKYDICDSLAYHSTNFQSRKLQSKTGIRDISLRYMTTGFQIYFGEVLPRNTKRVIYELLDMINPIILKDLPFEDIGKYINPRAKLFIQHKEYFMDEFMGFKHYMPYIPETEEELNEYTQRTHNNSRLNKYAMQWMRGISFLLYLKFKSPYTLQRLLLQEDSDTK